MNLSETELKFINGVVKIDKIGYYGTYSSENLTLLIGNNATAKVLSNNGFLDYFGIPMSGVSEGVHSFFTLTDRWRNLKRCGNYEALLEWENEQQRKQDEKIDLEFKLLKSQNDFQTINNTYVVEQEKLIKNQITTNENTQKTNTRIIAILIVTAAIYLFQLFASLGYIPARASGEKLHIQRKDSIIEMQEIRFYQQEIQKNQILRENDSLRKSWILEHHKP